MAYKDIEDDNTLEIPAIKATPDFPELPNETNNRTSRDPFAEVAEDIYKTNATVNSSEHLSRMSKRRSSSNDAVKFPDIEVDTTTSNTNKETTEIPPMVSEQSSNSDYDSFFDRQPTEVTEFPSSLSYKDDYENAQPISNKKKKKNNKKNQKIKTTLIWAYLLVASIAFAIVFCLAPMFPIMWKLICVLILALIVAIFGILSVMSSTKKNPVVRVTCFILALLLTIMSVLLPYYESRITNVINSNNAESDNRVKINFYAVTDAYRQAHADIFTDSAPIHVSGDQQLSEDEFKNAYADETIISMINTDTYQIKAINELDTILGTSSTLVDKETVTDGVDALYNNEGSLLMMNSSQLDLVKGVEEYEDFTDNAKVVYTIYLEKTDETQMTGTSDLTSKTFSVFFGGNDEEGELSLTGRTDVDMVVTVNPKTHQIIISSFPRDSYVENPALSNLGDKLTHLGVSGLSNTLEGLSNVLDTEIENYIVINFTTYRYIIDALGGVDIDNPYGFEADDGEYFEEGMIHLTGDPALMYVRERNHLPDGDFGRNMHQQLVMKAIIEKLSSPEIIVRFNSLLTALNGTFLTNLSSDAIYGFCEMQLNEGIDWNVITYRAEGEVGEAVTASMPSQNLSVVFPYTNHVEFMQEQIDKLEDGEILEQEEMPEGSGRYLEPWKVIEETAEPEQTYEPKETYDSESTPATHEHNYVLTDSTVIQEWSCTQDQITQYTYTCTDGDDSYTTTDVTALAGGDGCIVPEPTPTDNSGGETETQSE